MKTRIVAAVIAAFIATSAPAIAKVTIACKNTVEVSGPITQGERQAKSAARSKWQQTTTARYGQYWAQFSKAKYKHYKCKSVSTAWFCRLQARPCAQVTPPSASSS